MGGCSKCGAWWRYRNTGYGFFQAYRTRLIFHTTHASSKSPHFFEVLLHKEVAGLCFS